MTTLDDIATRVGIRFKDTAVMMQGAVVAEEAGELLKEVRRYTGNGRTGSTRGLLMTEAADVVIAVEVLARLLGEDLQETIEWKLGLIEDRGGL